LKPTRSKWVFLKLAKPATEMYLLVKP
jgi:hypothetical protein